jgi:hypothetical protein
MQNGTVVKNSMLHSSTLHNGTLQNGMLQSSKALRNGTRFLMVRYKSTVTKRYMLQNDILLQNGTLLKRYIVEQHFIVMVQYKNGFVVC